MFRSLYRSIVRQSTSHRRSRQVRGEAFAAESLESRQLLAGSVQVEVIGDTLKIIGDEQANNIVIESRDDGMTVIQGLRGTEVHERETLFDRIRMRSESSFFPWSLRSGNDGAISAQDQIIDLETNFKILPIWPINDFYNGPILLSGQYILPTSEFEQLKLEIDLKGGDDSIGFDGPFVVKSIDLETGDGNDRVLFSGIDVEQSVQIDLGKQNDQLIFRQVSIGGDLTIEGGSEQLYYAVTQQDFDEALGYLPDSTNGYGSYSRILASGDMLGTSQLNVGGRLEVKGIEGAFLQSTEIEGSFQFYGSHHSNHLLMSRLIVKGDTYVDMSGGLDLIGLIRTGEGASEFHGQTTYLMGNATTIDSQGRVDHGYDVFINIGETVYKQRMRLLGQSLENRVYSDGSEVYESGVSQYGVDHLGLENVDLSQITLANYGVFESFGSHRPISSLIFSWDYMSDYVLYDPREHWIYSPGFSHPPSLSPDFRFVNGMPEENPERTHLPVPEIDYGRYLIEFNQSYDIDVPLYSIIGSHLQEVYGLPPEFKVADGCVFLRAGEVLDVNKDYSFNYLLYRENDNDPALFRKADPILVSYWR